MSGGVYLSTEEARALADIIHMLSGGNPENVFPQDDEDGEEAGLWEDVMCRASAKLYRAAGHDSWVPDALLDRCAQEEEGR